MDIECKSARPGDLDLPTAYRILQLRVDVFVVEQDCAYRELDGRDLEPDALWFWAQAPSIAGQEPEILATLRILADPGPPPVRRIGRVVTAPSARSGGIAARLLETALAVTDGARVVLDAQSHLAGWYARFGFVVDGPEFVEDGIAHLPMARNAGHADR